MEFEGEGSLENNGGFTSLRGPVAFPAESATLLCGRFVAAASAASSAARSSAC